jgi:hypothetical protein
METNKKELKKEVREGIKHFIYIFLAIVVGLGIIAVISIIRG